MYAKLFSRITESSIMEEKVEVRYTFVLMLAISDPTGHVIGTNIAIARRLNLPVAQFERCLDVLMAPDKNSNSKEEGGRRIIPSEGERGYKVVNYLSYRNLKDEEERREYMRNYMQSYRRKEEDVNLVNSCKQELAELTQAELEEDVEEEEQPRGRAGAGITDGKDSNRIPTTDQSKRVAMIMHRRLVTPWSKKEVAAYRALGTIPEEDLVAIEAYYSKNWPPNRETNILRHDMLTLLNNWPGEVDRARAACGPKASSKANQWTAATEPTGWKEYLRTKYPDSKITTWAALPDDVKREVLAAK